MTLFFRGRPEAAGYKWCGAWSRAGLEPDPGPLCVVTQGVEIALDGEARCSISPSLGSERDSLEPCLECRQRSGSCERVGEGSASHGSIEPGALLVGVSRAVRTRTAVPRFFGGARSADRVLAMGEMAGCW